VGQRQRRRTVSPPFLAMTAPAIHILKQFCSPLNGLGRGRWLGWYRDGSGRRFVMKAGRKGLDVGHQGRPLLSGKGFPRRHAAVVNASADGVVQVTVSGKAPAGSRAALESGASKVARPGIKMGRILSSTIAVLSV